MRIEKLSKNQAEKKQTFSSKTAQNQLKQASGDGAGGGI